ncbi:MAG: hypothetical protein E7679_04855 [Ruminococcaceae bacterium]|nr:hypothetical protein [Oscillospiraceae bacterium]
METTNEKLKLKVYFEGNNYIGVVPKKGVRARRGHNDDPMLKVFKKYYAEAKKENISKRDLSEYLFEKMLNHPEQSYLLDKEEIGELIKKEATRIHNKKKRYRRKLGWFRPNWFVTFTYDDKLTDPESFERKLRRCLANLAYRNNWRYIGAREYGEEKGRLHFHFLMFIPEGSMVGQLFTDYHWNGFKREFFTNNTFFHERFGDTEFKPVQGSDLVSGRLSDYLVKYIEKQDQRLIYSRGLATEVEMEVDPKSDVFYTFYDFSYKCYLSMDLFYSEDELKKFKVDEYYEIDSEGMGLDYFGAQERFYQSYREKLERKKRRSA